MGFLLQPSFFQGFIRWFFLGGERWSQSIQMRDKIQWQVPNTPRTATGWPLAHETTSTIPSMQGISTYIWLICMVTVGNHTIHGSYGIGGDLKEAFTSSGDCFRVKVERTTPMYCIQFYYRPPYQRKLGRFCDLQIHFGKLHPQNLTWNLKKALGKGKKYLETSIKQHFSGSMLNFWGVKTKIKVSSTLTLSSKARWRGCTHGFCALYGDRGIFQQGGRFSIGSQGGVCLISYLNIKPGEVMRTDSCFFLKLISRFWVLEQNNTQLFGKSQRNVAPNFWIWCCPTFVVLLQTWFSGFETVWFQWYSLKKPNFLEKLGKKHGVLLCSASQSA